MKCLLVFTVLYFFYIFLFIYFYLLLLICLFYWFSVFCYSQFINCNHQNGNKEGLKYFTFLLSVVFMEMRFFLFNNEETALFQYIQIFELHI